MQTKYNNLILCIEKLKTINKKIKIEMLVNSIPILKKMGFTLWEKGEKKRAYIKPWHIKGIVSTFSKSGKKSYEINGEPISYTQTWRLDNTPIYIDLIDAHLHIDDKWLEVGENLRKQLKEKGIIIY